MMKKLCYAAYNRLYFTQFTWLSIGIASVAEECQQILAVLPLPCGSGQLDCFKFNSESFDAN